ncbi:hypothetical protein LLE49_19810 [Alicyclobacillus tolerans]|uniref:hypothetical protein n=1 Tax=Alicyclobacillus tolerans TaxID=90970 RepID=UPI001F2059CB|nr:hypothetical protein [Alicyclobacillus tolerans]MCF8566970.1 hypothetical protein [Alicyclobacillus tolerans]
MNYFYLCLQNQQGFLDVKSRLKEKYSDATIHDLNVTDQQTLLALLQGIRPSISDRVYIVYDQDFCEVLASQTDENSLIHYLKWNGVYSEIFRQISPEMNETKKLKPVDVLAKFSQGKTDIENTEKDEKERDSISVQEKQGEVERREEEQPVSAKPENYRPHAQTMMVEKQSDPITIRIIGNGGAGKTLFSLNLASFLLNQSKNVCVVGDPFTKLYALDRVKVVLIKDFSLETELDFDFIIFDGIDNDSETENEQKWLVVKNKIEYDHYRDFYKKIIFNDSDGFDQKVHVDSAYYMPFSEKIFRNFAKKNELLIDTNLFSHLSLFNQFQPKTPPKRRSKFIEFV